MFIKNIVTKMTVSLFVGLASVIGTQAGLTIWGNGLGDKFNEKTKHLFKAKG